VAVGFDKVTMDATTGNFYSAGTGTFVSEVYLTDGQGITWGDGSRILKKGGLPRTELNTDALWIQNKAGTAAVVKIQNESVGTISGINITSGGAMAINASAPTAGYYLDVSGNTLVRGNMSISVNATIGGTLSVAGTTTLNGNVLMQSKPISIQTGSNNMFIGGTGQLIMSMSLVVIGTSYADNFYVSTPGLKLAIGNTVISDTSVSGTIGDENVYNQFALGGGARHYVWSLGAVSNTNLYFGGTTADPNPRFQYTFKHGVGLKIAATPTSTDFTNTALFVQGNMSVTGDLLVNNISITGTLSLQQFTDLQSQVNFISNQYYTLLQISDLSATNFSPILQVSTALSTVSEQHWNYMSDLSYNTRLSLNSLSTASVAHWNVISSLSTAVSALSNATNYADLPYSSTVSGTIFFYDTELSMATTAPTFGSDTYETLSGISLNGGSDPAVRVSTVSQTLSSTGFTVIAQWIMSGLPNGNLPFIKVGMSSGDTSGAINITANGRTRLGPTAAYNGSFGADYLETYNPGVPGAGTAVRAVVAYSPGGTMQIFSSDGSVRQTLSGLSMPNFATPGKVDVTTLSGWGMLQTLVVMNRPVVGAEAARWFGYMAQAGKRNAFTKAYVSVMSYTLNQVSAALGATVTNNRNVADVMSMSHWDFMSNLSYNTRLSLNSLSTASIQQWSAVSDLSYNTRLSLNALDTASGQHWTALMSLSGALSNVSSALSGLSYNTQLSLDTHKTLLSEIAYVMSWNAATNTVTIGTNTNVSNIYIGSPGVSGQNIYLGGADDNVYISGTLVALQTTNTQISDNRITLNKGGVVGTGAGIEVEVNGTQDAATITLTANGEWAFKNIGGTTYNLSEMSYVSSQHWTALLSLSGALSTVSDSLSTLSYGTRLSLNALDTASSQHWTALLSLSGALSTVSESLSTLSYGTRLSLNALDTASSQHWTALLSLSGALSTVSDSLSTLSYGTRLSLNALDTASSQHWTALLSLSGALSTVSDSLSTLSYGTYLSLNLLDTASSQHWTALLSLSGALSTVSDSLSTLSYGTRLSLNALDTASSQHWTALLSLSGALSTVSDSLSTLSYSTRLSLDLLITAS
jgi:hypothetical protein